MEDSIAACTQCGAFGPVRRYEYGYGLPKRGINPRTFEEDTRPLGHDHVLLCPSCQRALFLRALRQFAVSHSWALATVVAAVLGVLAGRSFIEPGAVLSANLMALFAVVVGAVGFLGAWLWRREESLKQCIFEARREFLAGLHGHAAKELRLY